jgi:hypothetical protein
MANKKSNAPDVDDLFTTTILARKLVPAGEYAGQLVATAPFFDRQGGGIEATIRVTEGEHSGRLIRLRFVLNATTAEVLEGWWEEVGAEGRPSWSDGFPALFSILWRNGLDKRLLFKIDTRSAGRFIENTLLGVEWDAAGQLGIRS